MNTKENPTPRANAGRVEDICCMCDYIEKPVILEADFASVFVARRYRLALPVARAVVALANLGRAFQ